MNVKNTLRITQLFFFAALGAFSAQCAFGQPQLLGVWYGSYDTSGSGGKPDAEMWLEISSQQSKDGWDVRGHNRWNVLEKVDEAMQGDASLGKSADNFDSVSGHIADDGQSVRFSEDTRGSRMEAVLEASDTMAVTYYENGVQTPSFTVALKRVGTDYQPGESTVLGIDVSHHSGNVDWQAVKANNYRFAYVKASEGVDDSDAMFEQHWQTLRDAGLARGAYHFYVTEDDPVQQAQFFASHIKDDAGTLPPAVDVELLGANTTGDMSASLLTFLQTLESELGVKPAIYTSSTFWDQHYEPAFSEYHLWMAEYGVRMPRVPFGWETWTFWQHAADSTVEGVENTADINLLHPSIDIDTLLSGSAGNQDALP